MSQPPPRASPSQPPPEPAGRPFAPIQNGLVRRRPRDATDYLDDDDDAPEDEGYAPFADE